ncbi:methyltransferase-like protein 22 [Culicoides brevitarsis]|uniref:methyltransferase-like protein 22 n=1 Tax=Culicoides brevitarsis TaxID=469753 RepID=UPI00307C8AA4
MEVQSEIYRETDFQSVKLVENGNMLSKFNFSIPDDDNETQVDDDGDLVVKRLQPKALEIEHKIMTDLHNVGFQIWRGALLLADFIIHNRSIFKDKVILEVGSGVGLTSIIAAKYSKEVICTDVNIGQILTLIDGNITRNMKLLKSRNIKVTELDFNAEWSPSLVNDIKRADFVFAADVIYDNDLTESFVSAVEKLLTRYENIQAIYVALEKRFVFLQNDSMPEAPMYEYFVFCMEQLFERHFNGGKPKYQMRPVPLNFPQFFEYNRCKDLVLLKIFPTTRKGHERQDA